MAAVIRLVVLVLAAAALLGASVYTAAAYLTVDDVALPDVRGMPFDRANMSLRDVGLHPVAHQELDARAGPDAVVSQYPEPGSTVRRGRTVRIGVNAQAEARQAPTVVGLREHDAVARAAGVQVPVVRVSYEDSDRPAGTVVRQEPEPGAALGGADGLHLVVSRGLGAVPITIPDLRGATLEDARRQLQALGVRQIEEVAVALSFDRPYAVTDQRPAGGSSIAPSTPVTLVYALEGGNVVRVPELEGEPIWRAQLELRAARLQVGPIEEIDDPTRPVGVIEVRPSGYTVIGSAVALVVNGPVRDVDLDLGGVDDLPADTAGAQPVAPRLGDGPTAAVTPPVGGPPAPGGAGRPDPEPAAGIDDGVPAPGTTVVQADGSRLIPFRFDPAQIGLPSLTRQPYNLRLVVSDERGERVVLDRNLDAGEAVATSIQVYGDDTLLQTFVNDSFFQAWRP